MFRVDVVKVVGEPVLEVIFFTVVNDTGAAHTQSRCKTLITREKYQSSTSTDVQKTMVQVL